MFLLHFTEPKAVLKKIPNCNHPKLFSSRGVSMINSGVDMFIPPLDLNRRCERFVFVHKFGTEGKVYSSGRVNHTSLHSQTKGYIIAFRILWATFYINTLFYHDVGEILDLSQSEAPNLVMWRVRVMQPTVIVGSILMFRKCMYEMSLENTLLDSINKKLTVKRNGTLLVKWHFW